MRGLAVTLHALSPDGHFRPRTRGPTDDRSAEQPAYPWRGRIAVTAGNAMTAAARSEIAAFVGVAQPGHFSLAGWTVRYAGPSEWSYRRFVLHQAFLCKRPAGSTPFVIGSEMRGLTTSRDARGSYPFAAELVRLAADVKAVLGPATKVTYAADWSEYFGHQPADGSGDVAFHLDPLWRLLRSMRSASISIGRWRTGATATTPTVGPGHVRSTISLTSSRTSRAGRAIIGTTRARPTGARRLARRSPTGAASPGCSATRTLWRGGRTGTTTGRVASKARRRRPGSRRRSPCGFSRSAARRWTRVPISRTFSSTPRAVNRRCPISPPAIATISCSADT